MERDEQRENTLEESHSHSRGNFLNLITLLATYNHTLANVLTLRNLSIQNEVIELWGNTCRDKIL